MCAKKDPNLLRPVARYEEQVQQIESAQTQKLQDEHSTRYGINRKCVLNCSNFHVLSGLSPNIMHDYLEGCLLKTVKNLLRYY